MNELRHREASLEGGDKLPRSDWEGTDTHYCDGQEIGMVIYFNGTSWICKLLHEIEFAGDWDIGDWKITAKQFEAAALTGTPPFIVFSTTMVQNLNAEYLNGLAGDAYVLKSSFNAQTVLAAITDDTPTAVTLTEQTLLGRITGGNVAALSVEQILTMLGIADLIDTDIATHAALTNTHGCTEIADVSDIAVDANLSAAAQAAIAASHDQNTDTDLGVVGTKNPPIDADKAIYRDSTASDTLVTSTWTQIKAFLKTYFDTLYELAGAIATHAGLATGVHSLVKNKWDATEAPDADNDVDEGYSVGSRWIDVTNDKEYVCLDNTDGVAVWTETTGAGGGGAESFTDLDDTPADYAGQGGKMVVVKAGADGLEFQDVPAAGSSEESLAFANILGG